MPSKRLARPISNRAADVLVCVVDDDEAIRHALPRFFRSTGLPVETFASAQGYLNRVTHQGPSCLVLDVQLPALNGLELQQALAEREEQIVFITGYGDVPMCTQAMKAGAVDFLTKPVDENALLAAVSTALQQSVQIRERNAERAFARAKLERLTPREFEVLQRVIAGLLPALLARTGRRLPVILITAHDTQETREMAQRAGAAAYFRKPVDDQALLDAVAWALSKRLENPGL